MYRPILLISFALLSCTVSNKLSYVASTEETYEITFTGSLDFESIITRTDISSEDIITRSDFYTLTGITSPVSSPMPGIANSKALVKKQEDAEDEESDSDPVFIVAVAKDADSEDGETVLKSEIDVSSLKFVAAKYVIGDDSFELPFEIEETTIRLLITPVYEYEGCVDASGVFNLNCADWSSIADNSGISSFSIIGNGTIDGGTISKEEDSDGIYSSSAIADNEIAVAATDSNADENSEGSTEVFPSLDQDRGFNYDEVELILDINATTIVDGVLHTGEVGNSMPCTITGNVAVAEDGEWWNYDGSSLFDCGDYSFNNNSESPVQLTFITWFKSDSVNSVQSIFSRLGEGSVGDDGNTCALRVKEAGLEFEWADPSADGSIIINPATTLKDNTWYFVAASINLTSGTLQFYINGALVTTVAIPTGTAIPGFESDQVFAVGAEWFDAAPVNIFSGAIAAVYILNTEKSADEILEIYELQNGG
jgi:hypothetical protein